jgi:hypothetical protein
MYEIYVHITFLVSINAKRVPKLPHFVLLTGSLAMPNIYQCHVYNNVQDTGYRLYSRFIQSCVVFIALSLQYT